MVIKSLLGTEVRTIFGLKSANFTIEKGENIVFKVKGYGHGVGLSLSGGEAVAKRGGSGGDSV